MEPVASARESPVNVATHRQRPGTELEQRLQVIGQVAVEEEVEAQVGVEAWGPDAYVQETAREQGAPVSVLRAAPCPEWERSVGRDGAKGWAEVQ